MRSGAWKARNAVARYLANPATETVLASPLHRMVSGSLVELGYLGPRTGRRISLVTQYAESPDGLVIYPMGSEHKVWWRVFRGEGRPIRVRIRGTVRAGHARTLLPDDPGYAEALEVYRQRWPKVVPRASEIGSSSSDPLVLITFETRD